MKRVAKPKSRVTHVECAVCGGWKPRTDAHVHMTSQTFYTPEAGFGFWPKVNSYACNAHSPSQIRRAHKKSAQQLAEFFR